jgi:L-iditol 2-dehydrogenase
MLGLYLKQPSELELREFETQSEIRDHEARIRLLLGGICGSDLSVYKGKIPHAKYPLSPGHELLGEVVEAGESVELPIGSRAVVQPNTYCDKCEFCLKGQTNICENKQSLGVNSDGGFQEEFIIDSKYLIPVPEDLPDHKAVLAEPLSVVVHALGKVEINQRLSVAIVGCGTEGMLALTLTNYLGADITAVDINQKKLEKVNKYFPDVTAALPSEVEGKYDVVIEAAGARASVEQAFELVKPGGSLVLVGLTPEATLPVNTIVRGEITLYGSIIYTAPQDFYKSLEFLRDDEFDVDSIISEMFPFQNFNKAYEMALTGEHGKILLDFRK